jgi:hypothetical protein
MQRTPAAHEFAISGLESAQQAVACGSRCCDVGLIVQEEPGNRAGSKQSERNRCGRYKHSDHQHGVVAINGDLPPHGAHLTVWDVPN